MDITKLIKEKEGTIIDVRTQDEFRGGHVTDSINIPLQEIAARIDEVRLLTPPLILCCASGNRSRQVYNYLTQNGIKCYNAGSWLDVNYYQSQTK
jgi:rhodanese-related sulfurtransferase